MKNTILAVDDEPANLRMLERLFHKEFHVLTATGGEEALEILKREQVSLIISDQRMPGMTGTELLSKSLSTNPDAIKIILTGYTDPEALIEAINNAHVYKFVSKPWDPVGLKGIVREAIEEREGLIAQKRVIDGLVALMRSHPTLFPRHSTEPELATMQVE
ncbi:MAG TPA: response regulator [Blastocatellia bacterium]|nr:response regulator [Blastocatellia bacterium]